MCLNCQIEYLSFFYYNGTSRQVDMLPLILNSSYKYTRTPRANILCILLVGIFCYGFPSLSSAATNSISADFGTGAVIVGSNTNTCDGTIEGAVRYVTASHALAYCNASAWVSVASTQLQTQATLTTCDAGAQGVMRFNNGTQSSPVIASSATHATSGGAVAVTKPSGVSSGDLLIMTITTDNSASWSWPTGFTDVGAGLLYDGGSTDGQTFGMAWKAATGAEPSSYDTSISGGSQYFSASVMRITGADTVNPISAFSYNVVSTDATSPLTVTTPTITPTSDYNLILWVATGDSHSAGSYSYTVPSGMTHVLGPANDGTWSSHEIAKKTQTTAAATGTLSGTVTLGASSMAYLSYVLAIKPDGMYIEVCNGTSWQSVGR